MPDKEQLGFISPAEPSPPGQGQHPQDLNLRKTEVDLIKRALVMAGGNQTRAARILGISRDTLKYRLKKFEIS